MITQAKRNGTFSLNRRGAARHPEEIISSMPRGLHIIHGPMMRRSHRLSLAGALILLCLLAGAESRAAALDRYHGFEVSSLELKGLPEDAPSGWADGLALKPRWQLLGWEKASFSTKLLNDDVRRLRLQLTRIGFPRAQVLPRVEESDLEARKLDLVLEVQPGDPVLLAEMRVDGWPERLAPPDSSFREEAKVGKRFRDKLVTKVERDLETRLLNSGYEKAKVQTQVQLLSPDRVRVVYSAQPGQFSRIDSLRISGCSPDLESVARRIMDLDLPRDYSDRRLQEASHALRRTQLFRQVDLQTEHLAPGSLLLHAKLENARMQMWRAGVGTWSDNPWLVRADWTHRNFFHHGVGLETDGRVGAYEWQAGVRVFWLGWLTPASHTSLGLSMEVNDEDAYFSREQKIALTHIFGQAGPLQWKTGASFGMVDVEDYDPLEGDRPDPQGPMLEFWTDLMWDYRNTPTAPTQGHYFKIAASVAPSFLGVSEAPYASLQLDAAVMHPLREAVIATSRLRLGGSYLLGDAADLLATRRFYAGGFNTMRGYGRRHLGPDDAAGDPRGGQFTMLAGAELRFPILWRFAGAVFFDAGQVWRRRGDVALQDLSGAAGVALDLRTPIGPIRVNYARNVVNQLPGEGRDQFSVGVGYPW